MTPPFPGAYNVAAHVAEDILLRRDDSLPLTVRAWITLLRCLPLRGYSRLVRLLAELPLPRALRPPVLGWLASRLRMDLSEAQGELSDYRSFQELFVRRLRPEARIVDRSPEAIVSPVDGSLSALGGVEAGQLLQAKGHRYSLAELLGDEALAQALAGGTYVTLYLRPRDYHRIHCPLPARITHLQRIPGTLLPVQPYMVKGFPNLFVRNERLVLHLETAWGRAAMVCVGATGVGSISLAFTAKVEADGSLSPALLVDKGQEVAAFNLGSTVILVFAPGLATLGSMRLTEEVRMGQTVASITRLARAGDASRR